MTKATQQLDHEFDALFEVIERNYHAKEKHPSHIIAHFLQYYKRFNDLFALASPEDRQTLYDHLLLQHARLGHTADHVAEDFGVKIKDVPSFLEESSAQNSSDRILRQGLKKELDRFASILRAFKRSKHPRKKKAPSPYRKKV